MGRKKGIYALYKGEEYITDGTKQELAEYLNVKEKTITFYSSPAHKKRGRGEKGNRKCVVRIDIDD